MTKLFIGVTVFIALILGGSCADTERLVITLEGSTMGTGYTVTLVSPPTTLKKAHIHQDIESAMAAVNQWLSNYLLDSEISRINRAPINQWLPIAEETYRVIAASQKIAAETDGSFDITVSPLVSLWGFGPDKRERLPSDTEINASLAQVGWQHLQLDADTSSILKKAPVTVDLSAIGKGFGVDYLCDLLDDYNIDNYLVEIGGEIRVKGHNASGRLWRIGIETPALSRSGVQQAVTITNKAIATSGDYRNYYEKDGVRYSHTINPATGRPVEHNLASVTVISDSATEADAWATALNVMGPEPAMALAEKQDLALYLLLYDEQQYQSRYSSAFSQYMSDAD